MWDGAGWARGGGDPVTRASLRQLFSLTPVSTDTLLNVFLAIAVDNLANAQELTKVGGAGGRLPDQVACHDRSGWWDTGTGLRHLAWPDAPCTSHLSVPQSHTDPEQTSSMAERGEGRGASGCRPERWQIPAQDPFTEIRQGLHRMAWSPG
jgi:hypothetical protein